jgi:hypothetical protein
VCIKNKVDLYKMWLGERDGKEKSGEGYKDKIKNNKMLCYNIRADKYSENETP